MHLPIKLEDSTFSPASLVEEYLEDMWRILGKTSGRVFWTGKDKTYTNQPLGKNSLCKLPKEIARYLKLPNAHLFVFHSFRRTAATFASEAGMSDNELCDFFSWLNSSMAREYTSSTKRSARVMGGVLLGGNNRFGLSGPGAAPGSLSETGAAPGSLSGTGAAPSGFFGPAAAPGNLSGTGAGPYGYFGPGSAAAAYGPGAWSLAPYAAFPGWGVPPPSALQLWDAFCCCLGDSMGAGGACRRWRSSSSAVKSAEAAGGHRRHE